MKLILFILSSLYVSLATADTYSCLVKNKLEMVHFVKKYNLESSGSLYLLELHTLGEPFAHTATEGFGQINAEKKLIFKSYDFDLSAVLLIDKGIGSFVLDGIVAEFTDCFYQP